jgi:hypothetical protein
MCRFHLFARIAETTKRNVRLANRTWSCSDRLSKFKARIFSEKGRSKKALHAPGRKRR